MKIVTAAEMREIDRLTTEKHNIPSLMLMENAGSAVARFILRQYPNANKITVVCGKGNNGGDGFVAARKLHEAGRQVTALLLGSSDELRGDAEKMLKLLPVEANGMRSPQKVLAAGYVFKDADLIVDAIFGTGFRPPLPEVAAAAIDVIREALAPVVSVDVPSGIDSDSFVFQPHACRSSAIVTFTAPKPAIVFGAVTSGPIVVANIGSPQNLVSSNLGIDWNDPPLILAEARRLNSNKGLYGHALVIGGSLGKSGAPTMASVAALRSGAGLVTCAVPESLLLTVAGFIPELMTEPLEQNAGGVAKHAFEDPGYGSLMHGKNVVALGPGMGRDPDTETAIHRFTERCELPLVLDADGLNAFKGTNLKLLDRGIRPLVLTPHPGEMARMLGKSVQEIEADRFGIARRFAAEAKVILVLKGWRTLIADGDGHLWVNTTGNPGLAKGGSGDVLTGMIAGLIAQHPNQIVEAVRAAVYLHGLAADCALDRQTERTMLATDVIAALPHAFRCAERRDDFTWIQHGNPTR